MKCALLLVALAGASHGLTEEYITGNAKTLWSAFKNEHGKVYAAAEEGRRYDVFLQNMYKAAQYNREEPAFGATFGMNKFSDLTAEEFKAYHSLNVTEPLAAPSAEGFFTAAEVAKMEATDSQDWRTHGAVTQVKNQAQCGSCWAFSTTGGIEGQNFLHGSKTLVSVSEQELVSCDKNDNGCGGGMMERAYKYLLDNKGGSLVTEESYPYVSGGGNVPACKDTSSMAVGATIKGWKAIPHDNNSIKTFLANSGPVSIAVDARRWQTYTGGVLTNCCFLGFCMIDHGVLAVGYGNENGKDFWIIKNSWGASWGESGYIRVAFGQCAVTQHPVTATF